MQIGPFPTSCQFSDEQKEQPLIWIAFIIGAAFVLAASPFLWAHLSERELTDTIRHSLAPGRSIKLSRGAVQVCERGPDDGPVVVLVHGFSTPHFVFEQNASALEAAGFRVILFDHFGRGWSDRPKAVYDPDFFDRELLDLLDSIGLEAPVHLVGYSMGGIISTTFCARHPERVASLLLIAPAGLSISLLNEGILPQLLRMPWIGDWIWRLRARSMILDDPIFDESHLPPDCRLKGNLAEQMQYRGYFQAILSTWRNLPMSDCDKEFRHVSATGTPVLGLFGGQDATIGADSPDRLRTAVPSTEIKIVNDGNHNMLYQMHETISPLILTFLRSHLS